MVFPQIIPLKEFIALIKPVVVRQDVEVVRSVVICGASDMFNGCGTGTEKAKQVGELIDADRRIIFLSSGLSLLWPIIKLFAQGCSWPAHLFHKIS